MAQPRPDLAGLRVKFPANPAIYLIDPSGIRRWIPNPETYNNLFRDWNGVIIDIDIGEITEGPSLTNGAFLARAINAAPVYLISNGEKRWITSPAVMERYHFDWNRIQLVSQILLDSVPNGANWG